MHFVAIFFENSFKKVSNGSKRPFADLYKTLNKVFLTRLGIVSSERGYMSLELVPKSYMILKLKFLCIDLDIYRNFTLYAMVSHLVDAFII